MSRTLHIEDHKFDHNLIPFGNYLQCQMKRLRGYLHSPGVAPYTPVDALYFPMFGNRAEAKHPSPLPETVMSSTVPWYPFDVHFKDKGDNERLFTAILL